MIGDPFSLLSHGLVTDTNRHVTLLTRSVVAPLCAFIVGCGAATPEPGSTDMQPDGGTADGAVAAVDRGPRDDSQTDPETTEEVIETSEPLD